MKQRVFIYTFFASLILVISVSFLFLTNTKVRNLPIKSIQPSPSDIQKALSQSIGKVFIFGVDGVTFNSETVDRIKKIKPAGILLLGDMSISQVRAITDKIRAIPDIQPLFIAIDQEGGVVKRITDDTNPGGVALGLLDGKMFCDVIKNTSIILEQAGINTNFGIIGDIGWSPYAYISSRTYASSPQAVASKVQLAIECAKPILTTIKHFPGHGRTLDDTHTRIPHINLSYTEWLGTDAIPFTRSIQSGIPFLMVGHLIYDQIDSQPASISKIWHREIEKQAFSGLVITDDLGMLETAGLAPKKILEDALTVGNDLLLYSTSSLPYEQLLVEALEIASRSQEVSELLYTRIQHIEAFQKQHLTK